MNHCVPDFDVHDQDYPKKHIMGDEDTMELLWQNGQVVMQSQNHRHIRKPPHPPPARISGASIRPEVVNYSNNNNNQNLFMQEDEMTSWLHHCPIDYDDNQNFCADLLYSPPTPPVNANHQTSNNNNNSAMQTLAQNSQLTELRQSQKPVAPRPPIPPPRRTEQAVRVNTPNFAYFSKQNTRTEPRPSSSSRNPVRESTMVDSCETPFVASEAAVSRFSEATEGDGIGGRSMSATTTSGGGGKETTTFGMTSSPGGSSSSGEMNREMTVEDRKRKGRVETEEWESRNEDVDIESAEGKKQIRGSSTKRSRAAEVHNLSERKRRDRINEKMRALQELIPRCNKSDKASMLDEAIEYLKSLQLQVQMMSMGCGMVPMMFGGMQPYMPAMGMGMSMGMNRPLMPFPNMLTAGSATTSHLGPSFPMPPFHMPHVTAPDSARMQGMNQANNNLPNSVAMPVPNQSCIPNITDPYQQYLAPRQMQFQLMQNQAMNQVNVSKPSTDSGPEKPENHQPD